MTDDLNTPRAPLKRDTSGPVTLRRAGILLAAALALGLAFDLLVRPAEVGLGFVLFWLVLAGSLVVARRPKRVEAYVLAAASVSIAAWALLRSAPYLLVIDIAGALFLLSAAAGVWRYETRIWNWHLRDVVWAWIFQGLWAVLGAGPLAAAVYRSSRRPNVDAALPWLRGVALALPVLLVFGALLASADRAFADLIDGLSPAIDISLGSFGTHVVVVALTAWLAAGLISYTAGFAAPRDVVRVANQGAVLGQDLEIRPGPPSTRRPWQSTELLVVLGSVAVLFAFFVGVQFAFMFRGDRQIEISGLTYSEYARQGFWQLLTVAMLTVAMVWGMLRIFPSGSSPRATAVFKLLAFAMLALTGVILVSALIRLDLYQQAYGYTRSRVGAEVFTWWVGSVLALLMVQVFITRRHVFVAGWIVTAYLALMVFNLINPDALIANRNLDRAIQKDGRLDAAYLVGLSTDAVPVLQRRFATLPPDLKERVDGALYIDGCSKKKFNEDGWRAWNLARKRAADVAPDPSKGPIRRNCPATYVD